MPIAWYLLVLVFAVTTLASITLLMAQDSGVRGADRGSVERAPERERTAEREKKPIDDKKLAVYSQEPVFTVTSFKWHSSSMAIDLTFLQNRNEDDSDYLKRVFNTVKAMRKQYKPE